jgi:(2Fe-2S) ferredoxin
MNYQKLATITPNRHFMHEQGKVVYLPILIHPNSPTIIRCGQLVFPGISMKEYERHLIVCDGDDCCKHGGGRKLLKLAKDGLGSDSRFVKCSTVSCLGQCKRGPVLIVYPDGVWYHCKDHETLSKIVNKHLRKGKVVKKRVLFRMPAKSATE